LDKNKPLNDIFFKKSLESLKELFKTGLKIKGWLAFRFLYNEILKNKFKIPYF